MYYPGAFDAASLALIEACYPPLRRIPVEEHDAVCFACNAVNVGQTILLNEISPALRATLEARDFHVVETPLSEFLKAGGAAKCLVLRLSELAVTHSHAPQHSISSAVSERHIGSVHLSPR